MSVPGRNGPAQWRGRRRASRRCVVPVDGPANQIGPERPQIADVERQSDMPFRLIRDLFDGDDDPLGRFAQRSHRRQNLFR